jgi:hypothetical protein
LVAGRFAASPENGGTWDWALAAEVGTAVGTTLLAIATFVLAYGTRNPQLGLSAFDFLQYCDVDPDSDKQRPSVRLIVRNAPGRRAAKGARVMLVGFSAHDEGHFHRLGVPSLGWPSGTGESVTETIFGGSDFPIGLGVLYRLVSPEVGTPPYLKYHKKLEYYLPVEESTAPEARWYFLLSLRRGVAKDDTRTLLAPGKQWTIRLALGADEADYATYDVNLGWDAEAPSAKAALESVRLTVTPATA